MTKDGAGSGPGAADLGSTSGSAVVPAESVAGKVADENATLARPVERVRPPRPPMPHAKIRPTASFPRVTSAGMPRIPSLVVPEDEDEVTHHKGESIDKVPTAATGEINDAMTMARAAPPPRPAAGGRPNDDVTRAQPSPLAAARMSMQMAAQPSPAPPASLKPVLPPSPLHSVPSPDFTVEVESGSGVSSGARKSGAQDAHSATTLVQGDVIGGLCRIEERLALSEMSVLYRAFHLQLERMVVVKVLQDAGVENVEAVARFRREARLMSLVTSEHVARVLDVGSHEGCPFIVMERLEGADLAYLMKQTGRMPLRQACDLVLQICEALAVAHSYGIVHRDLKPANVFVSVRAGGDLRVTIIDFGIAKAFFQQKDAEDQLTKVDGLLGSPRYMAPEQVEPRMEVDERADIWALGIIFQEILTGERVFNADGVVQLLMAIVESAPVPLRKHLPDAPDAIVATVAQALEKDPTRRLPNALTFAARVAPFASPDALQRVANIAGIAAAAVERAAESRPSFQDRATLPPKSPAVLGAGSGPGAGPSLVDVASIPPASPRSATLPSSNPPPTMRLPRELIVSSPAAPLAPVLPVLPVPPVVPLATTPAGLVVPTGPMMTLPNEPVTAVDAVAAVDPRDEIAGLDVALDAALADKRDRRRETVKLHVDDVMAARPRVRSRTAVLIAVVWVAIAVGAAMVAHAVLSGPSPTSSASPDIASPSTAAAPSAAVTATTATMATTTATVATTAPPETTTTASPEPTAPAPAASALASAASAASADTTASVSPSASAVRPSASASSLAVLTRPATSASAAGAVAAGGPAPAATGTGTLTVVCLPKCDQILDNGAVLGNGYVFGQQVSAGHHTLSLSSSNGVKKTMPVDIPPNGTKELRVSMEK